MTPVALATMAAILGAVAANYTYSVTVVDVGPRPLLSYIDGTSTFQEVFNPSWVQATKAQPKQGLLVRSQNCSASVGGSCVHCSGSGQQASVITFSEATSMSSTSVQLSNITAASVVFQPADGNFDNFGTEDPRIQLDATTGIYYMFYTSYGAGTGSGNTVLLSLASTKDPTNSAGWTRHGAVFPEIQGSKSAALLLRETGPHFLLWGDTVIAIANSSDPTVWPSPGHTLLSPREGMFDDQLVEAGPPPLMLSTGDYIFFHNSADHSGVYHPSWAILSGADPSVILARASEPLLSPVADWEQGVQPWTCNVANVVFLEAATPTEEVDLFRVFYGGADAVVGTATIRISHV